MIEVPIVKKLTTFPWPQLMDHQVPGPTYLINTITQWNEPPRKRQVARALAVKAETWFVEANKIGRPRIDGRTIETLHDLLKNVTSELGLNLEGLENAEKRGFLEIG